MPSLMDELTRIRKRIPKSCRRCHRRKQRCVGAPVCANCELAHQPCVRSDTVPSWHHGMSKGALVQRIEALETQLASLTERNVSDSVEQEREREQERDVDRRQPGTEETRSSSSSSHSRSNSQSHFDLDPHGGAAMHFLIQGHGHEDKSEGNYLGPSSGLVIAENISRIVQDAFWKSIPVNETHEFLTPCENEGNGPAPAPDDAMGARILDAYFKSMHMRLPFLCRSEIYELHSRRHHPPGPGSSTQEQFARFKIFMVYAIGAATLKMTEMYDSTPPRSYFLTALQYQPSLQESLSISSIETLMLLAMYNLQSSASSSVWYMMGLATRICVDFGLHREISYRRMTPYDAQRRKRLFWSVYLNERAVSWSLGRPFSIDDHEIDAEPPADIDDSLTDDAAIEEMIRNPWNPRERVQGPNIRCFIACVKLSRISSLTRARAYRLDRELSTLLPEIHPLMHMLEEYRREIPCLSAYEDDFIHMHWNSAIRTLLQPFLSILPPDHELARKCLYAAGQMCQYFKRLRQRESTWYSFLLINTIFMSGLTMCLCLFRSPTLYTMSVSNDLRACQSALFVMAERHPSVRKYRDALETTINRVMDYVSDAQSQQASASAEKGRILPLPEPYGLNGTLADPSTPFLSPPSPHIARGLGAQTPRTPETTASEGRAFSGLFVEDFWAGDAFSLHMGEAFGLRT